jgi:hypothetical protein
VSDPSVLKSALIRAARTFIQVFVGVYLAGLLGDGVENSTLANLLDLDLAEKALVAAVPAVLAVAHRYLDTTPIPSLQDRPPAAVEGVPPEDPDHPIIPDRRYRRRRP